MLCDHLVQSTGRNAPADHPVRDLAALADEVGNDVEVVELYTGSLGEEGSGAETYITMMETNVQRIADAMS